MERVMGYMERVVGHTQRVMGYSWTLVSLNVRLKDRVRPVTRVKQKKNKEEEERSGLHGEGERRDDGDVPRKLLEECGFEDLRH